MCLVPAFIISLSFPHSDFNAALEKVNLMGYWSRSDKALRMAQVALSGEKGGREDVHDVVIMMTDGKKQQQQQQQQQ